MEDASSLAFELVLQPSALDQKLFVSESKRLVLPVFKELLSQLSAMSTKVAEGQTQPVSGNEGGNSKKMAYIQLMVLRIAAHLEWDLDKLKDCSGLQMVLLETLVSVTKENGGDFANSIFNRWIVRTAPTLNFPAPPVGKAQIYNNGGSTVFSVIDPGAAVRVNTSCQAALKALQELADSDRDTVGSVPSQDSFAIGPDSWPTCTPSRWATLPAGTWRARVLVDLAGYYLFVEDYRACRTCVAKAKAVGSAAVDASLLAAYEVASSESDNTTDGGSAELPLYQSVCRELEAKYKGNQELYEELAVANVSRRIESGLPLSLSSADLVKKCRLGSGMDVLAQYMVGAKKVNNYGKAPALGSVDKPSQKSKQQKLLRRRDLLLSLIRERRPDRVQKLVQDLQKLSVHVRRAVSRWTIDDPAISMATERAPDGDYMYVLLAKAKQMASMNAFHEAPALYTALEKALTEQPWSQERKTALHNLRFSSILARMEEYQHLRGVDHDDDDFARDVRSCFDGLATAAGGAEGHGRTFELAVVVLLNLGEFEFILSRSDKRWNLIQLAGLLSSAVLGFRSKMCATAEFKKTCRALADIIMPVVQQTGQGTKRGARDSGVAKDSQEKQWICRLLRRLHNPDVLSLLCAFLITYYNSTNEDASLEIQTDLPALPLTVNSSMVVNEDSLLNVIRSMANSCSSPALPWALRVKAEIHFAQGNYYAAMQDYMRTLVVSTQYFQKPWSVSMQPSSDSSWDDRMFAKMIKCTTELGHYAQSMVMCQFQAEVDYVTAFKALEERSCYDAMDDLYAFMWDVTILEYAVSMHTKRGEMSRKKKALDTIGQLDINTNNNEEILREARSSRRSSFLRYMASCYL